MLERFKKQFKASRKSRIARSNRLPRIWKIAGKTIPFD